jgi:hypothetical protein
MPRPIRTITLAAGALILIFSLISVSIYWPRLIALDWSFYRILLIVGAPLAYILIAITTGQTPCYWLAIGLLKLETFQWLLIECCDRFVATYKEMYPIRERQVRSTVSDAVKDKIRSWKSYEDYLASQPQYTEDMKALVIEMDRVKAIKEKEKKGNE